MNVVSLPLSKKAKGSNDFSPATRRTGTTLNSVFRDADDPEGVTKQEWHAAVEAPPSGTATAAGVFVIAVVPPSVDFFLILNVDPWSREMLWRGVGVFDVGGSKIRIICNYFIFFFLIELADRRHDDERTKHYTIYN